MTAQSPLLMTVSAEKMLNKHPLPGGHTTTRKKVWSSHSMSSGAYDRILTGICLQHCHQLSSLGPDLLSSTAIVLLTWTFRMDDLYQRRGLA